mmetsp:Transcript_25409/g.37463  ORF Transcript_25409/g.37463 Transcript_25409/m.37463 type:complete len:240 (+) Transcript_25409:46-765(+)
MRSIAKRSFSNYLTTVVNMLARPTMKFDPFTLYDATSPENKYWDDDWECSSDAVYDGPSISELMYEADEKGDDLPYLRFQGTMDMTRKKALELGVTGGFCAMKGDVDTTTQLKGYKGLEMIYRSGTKTACAINLTMENMSEEDVFQTKLVLMKTEGWTKMHIPLDNFRLTLMGQLRQGQGPLDECNIETFGMIITSHRGPFRIDIHKVTVIPEVDSEYTVQSSYTRPSFLRLPQARSFR